MLVRATGLIVLDRGFYAAFQVRRQVAADSLALNDEREDFFVGPVDFFESGAGWLLVELIDFLRPSQDSRLTILLVQCDLV